MPYFPDEGKIRAIFQKPQGKTVLNKVIETINRYKMLKQNDCIVLGVSGGGDSVFLVLTLFSLKRLYNVKIYLAHLNHLLREDADKDEEFVCEIGKTLNLPVITERIDVKGSAKPGENLEEVARNLRLEFLRRTKEKVGGDKIALGHSLNDVVETFLFNLSRGAGFQGLTGIWPVRGDVIRPIITFKRHEIRKFLHNTGVPYRDDPTNYDLNLARNFIRHKVIPVIEERFPRFQEHVFQTTELNRELIDFLDDYVPPKERLIKFRGEDYEVLNLRELSGLSPVIQRWFFYRYYGLGFLETERLLPKLRTGGHLKTKTYEIWISYGEVLISKYDKIHIEPINLIKWTEKSQKVPEYNMIFLIRESKCRKVEERKERVVFHKEVVDRDSLRIRSWKYGDRIYLSGKMVKVKDIFQRHRVPLWRRRLWVIVEDKDGILWVVNLVKASRTNKGNRCITMEVKKINEEKGWIFDY